MIRFQSKLVVMNHLELTQSVDYYMEQHLVSFKFIVTEHKFIELDQMHLILEFWDYNSQDRAELVLKIHPLLLGFIKRKVMVTH